MALSPDDAARRIAQRLGRVPDTYIIIDTARQELALIANAQVARVYPVSTSRFGVGNRDGSCQTPLGLHRIAEKIGQAAPWGAVFRARQDTGERWTGEPPAGDLILTRILRLEGLEDGLNRGPGIDSFERFIYIHGTHDESAIGAPASHGCIRMRNDDVIDLFERVHEGAIVLVA